MNRIKKKTTYNIDGVEREKYYLGKLLHRIDGPAIIEYFNNGNIACVEWYYLGVNYRPATHGPVYTKYRRNGCIAYEEWCSNDLDHPKYIHYDHFGKIVSKAWEFNGMLHRSLKQGPAVINYFHNGSIREERWYIEGRLHRVNELGPALISYHEEGYIIEEKYYIEGRLHRVNELGPARIRYNSKGYIVEERYYIENRLHRVDGPAWIRYNLDGSIFEKYYENGLCSRVECKKHIKHSSNKPAVIIYYKNDNVLYEEYYQNGRLHKSSGPAIVIYESNGEIHRQVWYNFSKLVPIEEVYNIIYTNMKEMLSLHVDEINLCDIIINYLYLESELKQRKTLNNSISCHCNICEYIRKILYRY